jgi:chromosome segregation ATPase
MDCCCPADHEPQYGVYVNNLQSVRATAQKSKFSFRTTAAGSSHSRASHSSLSEEDHEQ